MEIRQATATDEEAVCRLWKMLLDFYRKEATMEMLRRCFRYAVNHPEQIIIYLAEIDGAAAGTASLHMGHYSTWNDDFYGHVEDLVVDPHYRDRGIAEALLKVIMETAREHNLGRLELNCLNDNLPARKLYEKMGFKTDSVVYEHSLIDN